MALVLCLAATAAVRADQFEYYYQPVLTKALEDKVLKEVASLSVEEMEKHLNVLADTQSAFLVVETNDRRLTKLLVQPARLRVGEEQVPLFLVEKYLTFREGSERAIKASGQNTHLYNGSRIHLDQGQIVPEKLGGDLIAQETEGKLILKPVGKAKLYVLTKAIPGVVPKKKPKLAIGEEFQIKYFNGTYKLYDDGRRTGVLKLLATDDGEVSGTYTSDKDGREYEVKGKVGQPQHSITFEIKYPATKQAFSGHLFTGNGKIIAGTTTLQERNAGFYAERIEE
jgi:hypothetical protein